MTSVGSSLPAVFPVAVSGVDGRMESMDRFAGQAGQRQCLLAKVVHLTLQHPRVRQATNWILHNLENDAPMKGGLWTSDHNERKS